jgi:hypothetical protein
LLLSRVVVVVAVVVEDAVVEDAVVEVEKVISVEKKARANRISVKENLKKMDQTTDSIIKMMNNTMMPQIKNSVGMKVRTMQNPPLPVQMEFQNLPFKQSKRPNKQSRNNLFVLLQKVSNPLLLENHMLKLSSHPNPRLQPNQKQSLLPL